VHGELLGHGQRLVVRLEHGHLVGVVVLAVPPIRGAGHGEQDALPVVDLVEVEHLVVRLEDVVAGQRFPPSGQIPLQVRAARAEQPVVVVLLQMVLPLHLASLPAAVAPHATHEALHRLVHALLFVPRQQDHWHPHLAAAGSVSAPEVRLGTEGLHSQRSGVGERFLKKRGYPIIIG